MWFKQIRQPSVREGIKMISNHITNFNDMICLGQIERKPSHDYPNKSSSCFAQFLRCSASPWMILSRPVFCLLITVSILPATTETPSAISSSKTHLPQAFTGDSSLLLLPYIYFYSTPLFKYWRYLVAISQTYTTHLCSEAPWSTVWIYFIVWCYINNHKCETMMHNS